MDRFTFYKTHLLLLEKVYIPGRAHNLVYLINITETFQWTYCNAKTSVASRLVGRYLFKCPSLKVNLNWTRIYTELDTTGLSWTRTSGSAFITTAFIHCTRNLPPSLLYLSQRRYGHSSWGGMCPTRFLISEFLIFVFCFIFCIIIAIFIISCYDHLIL